MISLAWTHSFEYLGINFQANGIIQVNCLAIKSKFYSMYNIRPINFSGQLLQQSQFLCSLLFASNVLEANHGFTLRAKRTAFTRLAITPPKVNRFG